MSEVTTPLISHGTNGLLHRTEARFLYETPGRIGGGKYADLGTFCGRSSILMSGGMLESQTSGSVTTVDTFDQRTVQEKYQLKGESQIDHVRRMFEQKGVSPLIHILCMTTTEAAYVCRYQKFDFIFVDADHSYEAVSSDFNQWSPLLSDGGEIGFHDTNWPGVSLLLSELPGLGWVKTNEVYTLQTWRRQ